MADSKLRDKLRDRLWMGFYDKEFMSGLLELIDELWKNSELAVELTKNNLRLEKEVKDLKAEKKRNESVVGYIRPENRLN